MPPPDESTLKKGSVQPAKIERRFDSGAENAFAQIRKKGWLP
jgi:hypothetical protein